MGAGRAPRPLAAKIRARLREGGGRGLAAWAVRECAARILRPRTLDVLVRDVTGPFPRVAARVPVTCRALSDAGGEWAARFLRDWPAHVALFERRLLRGVLCIAAFREERSLGYIWVTDRPEVDRTLGLTVAPAGDETYGFDLYVLPERRPELIGQELIGRWLDHTRASGRRWALGVVEDVNRPMQVTTRIVFGFRTRERLKSLEFFGRRGIIVRRTAAGERRGGGR